MLCRTTSSVGSTTCGGLLDLTAPTPVDRRRQLGGGGATLADDVLADRRQRRSHALGELRVVEAHDGDVLRDAQPEVDRRPDASPTP